MWYPHCGQTLINPSASLRKIVSPQSSQRSHNPPGTPRFSRVIFALPDVSDSLVAIRLIKGECHAEAQRNTKFTVQNKNNIFCHRQLVISSARTLRLRVSYSAF